MYARPAPAHVVDALRPPGARDLQPCFGVGCMARGSCACYDAVERATEPVTRRATCARDGAYPGYRVVAATPGPGLDGWPGRAQLGREPPSEPLISGSSEARNLR